MFNFYRIFLKIVAWTQIFAWDDILLESQERNFEKTYYLNNKKNSHLKILKLYYNERYHHNLALTINKSSNYLLEL